MTFRFFDRLSIRAQLFIIILSVVLIAAITGYSANTYRLIQNEQKQLLGHAHSVAEVLGQDLARMVLLNDPRSAADATSRLGAFPQILNVYLYDDVGQPTYRYRQADVEDIQPPEPPKSLGVGTQPNMWVDDYLHLFQPASYQGTGLGTLYMRLSVTSLQEALITDLIFSLIIGLGVIVLSAAVAFFFEEYFNSPIIRLVAFVNRVRREGDFNLRTEVGPGNEINVLARSINDLMEEIQTSNASRDAKDRELRRQVSIIEQCPVTVVLTDLDGKIVYTNPHFTHSLGYTAEEVAGENPRLLKSGLIPDETYKAMWEQVAAGKSWHGDFPNKHKNGHVVWERGVVTAIKSAEGELTHFAALRVNINELKQTEAELIRSKEEAEQANQAKSDFLAAMSHDLRTPLNAIMGFSELMQQRVFGPLGAPQYEDYVEDIHNSGAILVSLINDVLDLSKIEAGCYELVQEPIPLDELIGTSTRQNATIAELSGIELTNRIEEPGLKLLGDRRALLQVLNNLLSNAIKFSPQGGKVSVSAQKENTGQVAISVADEGIGMAQDDIAKAILPFQQLDHGDAERARKFEGTGLGLHLCQKFMVLFGGTLEIESQQGEGTTVRLRFPAACTLL
ncbi:MAG: ATP-binding protein [Magnetovibrionaceae bacterium]